VLAEEITIDVILAEIKCITAKPAPTVFEREGTNAVH